MSAGGPGGAADSGDARVGRTVGSHYRLESVLGRGGMGVVYRARHELLDDVFAVKVLAPEISADESARRRFLLEAKALARIAHRNVVAVRHFGEERGADPFAYLVMEFCEGETLATLLDRDGTVPPARAVDLVVQVLAALEAAHEAGVVHRDLKPSNVMVTPARSHARTKDEVRVLDFGLARVHAAGAASSVATAGVALVGTVAYMAPEQLRGEAADARSDVHAAGVLLHEMLTGKRPYDGDSPLSTAVRILHDPPPPLGLPDGAAGAGLGAVVLRALDKDPERRFQSAGAFADALRELAPVASAAEGGGGTGTKAGRAVHAPSPEAEAALAPARSQLASARGGSPLSGASTPPDRRRGLRRIARWTALAAIALATAATVAWLRRDDPTAWRRDAERALAEGRFADSEDAFGRVEATGELTAVDRLHRARARIELGRRSAEVDLRRAEEELPDDARVALERARWFRTEKEFAKADAVLESALRSDPSLLDAYVERMRLRRVESREAEIPIDADELSRRAPGDPRGAWWRASVRVNAAGGEPAAGRVERAQAALAEARNVAALDPSWAEASALVAHALFVLGTQLRREGRVEEGVRRWEEAETVAQEAVETAIRARGYRQQGQALFELCARRQEVQFWLADTPAVESSARELLAWFPHDDRAVREAAYEFLRAGRLDEAAKLDRDLEAAAPHGALLAFLAARLRAAGVLHARAGDRRAAREAFREAVERMRPDWAAATDHSNDPGDYAATWFLLSQVEDDPGVADRDRREAQRSFDAMRAPDGRLHNVDALARLSEMSLALGDVAIAVETATRAVDGAHDRDPSFYLQLAACHRAAARTATAEGDAGRALADLAKAESALADALPLDPARGPLLAARIHVDRARLQTDPAVRALDLATAHADAGDAQAGAKKRRARADPASITAEAEMVDADAFELEGDATNAERAVVRAIGRRESEHAAGRWALDRSWYETLARIREARGDAEGASRARAAASSGDR